MAASYEARPAASTAGCGGERAGCARTRSSSSPVQRLHRGERGVVRALPRDGARCRGPLDGGGLPRRRRPRAHLRHPGRDRQRPAARGTRALGLAVTVGIARTKLLAKMASRAAKPDGLLLVDRGERTFLHPIPVGSSGGWARRPRPSSTGSASRPSASSPVPRRPCAGARISTGRHLHAVANQRDPRRVGAGPAALVRLAVRARAPAALARRDRGRARRAGRPRHPADADRRAVRPHRRPEAALRRLHARDPLAHAAPVDRRDRIRAARRPQAARRGGAGDQAQGSPWSGSISNLEPPGGVQLELPLDGAPAGALDAALDELRGATAPSRSPAAGR